MWARYFLELYADPYRALLFPVIRELAGGYAGDRGAGHHGVV